jgi:hypothetical protein
MNPTTLAMVSSGGPSLHPGVWPVVAARLIDVSITPDPNQLPGGQVLQNLMNGLDSWALALALVGLVIGAAAWALGSHGQHTSRPTWAGRPCSSRAWPHC